MIDMAFMIINVPYDKCLHPIYSMLLDTNSVHSEGSLLR
jgi:hypothetical protein